MFVEAEGFILITTGGKKNPVSGVYNIKNKGKDG